MASLHELDRLLQSAGFGNRRRTAFEVSGMLVWATGGASSERVGDLRALECAANLLCQETFLRRRSPCKHPRKSRALRQPARNEECRPGQTSHAGFANSVVRQAMLVS